MELAARTEDLWQSFEILPQKEIPKFHLRREILKFQNYVSCGGWNSIGDVEF
ncbi:hypothetical protein [uncultured Campylobacter sp.]|uniref:hypothetical protein n=1 Tax=uncultured Campylobacter sp. TaxID=218934 RepID=UPI002624A008|nr:hypothetical protein [uncultured Campylobacter sp.]